MNFRQIKKKNKWPTVIVPFSNNPYLKYQQNDWQKASRQKKIEQA